MTTEFKHALIEELNERGEDNVVNWQPFSILRLMIPWAKDINPKVELENGTIDWNIFKNISGLKRLDFFLNTKAPKFSPTYPMPTIGSILHSNMTYENVGKLIVNHYCGAGTFAEAFEELNKSKP